MRLTKLICATIVLLATLNAADEAALFDALKKAHEPATALALAQRGEAAVPFLVQGLESNGRVAALCAWALAQHPQPGASKALRDRLWRVEQAAGYWSAKALGRMPTAENVDALAALLPDKDAWFWELSSGGKPRLKDAWNEKGQRYTAEAPADMPNLRVAYAAAEALGEIGGDKAAAALMRALSNDQYLIRFGAARGLGRMAHEPAEAKLADLAEKDPVLIVRRGAQQALAVLRGAATGQLDILRSSPTGFPLTPALSLGERENRVQPHTETGVVNATQRDGKTTVQTESETQRAILPLLKGEGRGEGKGTAAETTRSWHADHLPPSIAFIKTKLRSDATLGFRDSYFFPKTPRFHSGENLYTLTPPAPDGDLKNLTQLSNGEVQGPEISFDGTKLLFAMRRDKTRDGFHIFEINTDGSGLRQLTDGNCNDADPCYLADGRIAFCSDRAGWQEYYHQERSRVLYVMNGDGSGIQQITFNPNQDYEPFALRDGRIIYSTYRFYAQDGSEGPMPGEFMGLARIETVLHTCNPDGSADNLFYGSMRGSFYVPLRPMAFSDQFAGWHRRGYHVGVSVSQQRELSDGRIICTTPAGLTIIEPALAPLDCELPIYPEVVNLAGGEEVYIHNYDELNPVGRYTTPHPLAGDWILVSHAPFHDLRVNGYGIYAMNIGTRELKLLYDDPQMSDVDPIPLVPRATPLPRPTTLTSNRDTGLIYCNSVFNTDQPFDRDAVRYVRVLEGIQMGQSINANGAFRTRLLGVAPIHNDGSFYVEVPADVPIRFELIDEDGQMLIHETEFSYVRPGETKGCVGCHENRRDTTPNARPLALDEPPTKTLREPGDLIYMGRRERSYNRVYRD